MRILVLLSTISLHFLNFVEMNFSRDLHMRNKSGGVMVQSHKVNWISQILSVFLWQFGKIISQPLMHCLGIITKKYWIQVPGEQIKKLILKDEFGSDSSQLRFKILYFFFMFSFLFVYGNLTGFFCWNEHITQQLQRCNNKLKALSPKIKEKI